MSCEGVHFYFLFYYLAFLYTNDSIKKPLMMFPVIIEQQKTRKPVINPYSVVFQPLSEYSTHIF